MKGTYCLLGGIIFAGAVLYPSAPSRADTFNLGQAASYAVLFEGVGNNQLNFNTGAITGNVGLGPPIGFTGTPQFTISNASLTGNIDFAGSANTSGITGSPPNNVSGGGTFIGSVNSNSTTVTSALATVNALSSTLGGESGTNLAISIGNGSTQTVNESSGALVNGDRVFTVTSLNFVNGATLAINGDGTGDPVVFNIDHSNVANPQFGGTILLSGLISDQVLFNVTGGANLSGGDTLQATTNGADLTGIFLDPNGPMSINHAVLDGRFFGGDSSNMQIVSGAFITAPAPAPVVTPLPSALTAGLALLGWLLFFRRYQSQRSA